MPSAPTLLFVYNADSGVFNLLAAIGHKLLSPSTYKCNLCALTHDTFGAKKEWRKFLESLPFPVEFLHADEFRFRYGREDTFPAIYVRRGGDLTTLVPTRLIDESESLAGLQQTIEASIDRM
jgi:hypothetical protein